MRYQLVDRVETLDAGERIVGTKAFSRDAEFVLTHFPRRPLVPLALLMEAGGQLASRLIKSSVEAEVEPLLVLAEGVKVLRQASVGVTLRFDVEVLSFDARASSVSLAISEGDERVVTVDGLSFVHAPVETGGVRPGTRRSGGSP